MEGPRTYSFPLTIGLLLCLLSGFGMGMFITQELQHNAQAKELTILLGAQSKTPIMNKRLYAVVRALKKGRTEYEFNIDCFPPLNGEK